MIFLIKFTCLFAEIFRFVNCRSRNFFHFFHVCLQKGTSSKVGDWHCSALVEMVKRELPESDLNKLRDSMAGWESSELLREQCSPGAGGPRKGGSVSLYHTQAKGCEGGFRHWS